MNLGAASVVLRPRALADVLDLTVPFCLANWRPLGKLSLVLLGPVGAAAAIARLGFGFRWTAVWLILAALAPILEGAFTIAAGDLLFRDPAGARIGPWLARLGRRLPPYVMALLMRGIAVTAGAMFLVLAPMIGASTLFVPEAILLEGIGPWKAFGRAGTLARGRRRFCLGLWLATVLLPTLGAIVGDLVGNTVVGFVLQLGKPLGDLWTDKGSGFAVAGALLALPIAAAARFLGYTDVRTRKEGWDIQLRFLSLVDADARRQKAV